METSERCPRLGASLVLDPFETRRRMAGRAPDREQRVVGSGSSVW